METVYSKNGIEASRYTAFKWDGDVIAANDKIGERMNLKIYASDTALVESFPEEAQREELKTMLHKNAIPTGIPLAIVHSNNITVIALTQGEIWFVFGSFAGGGQQRWSVLDGESMKGLLSQTEAIAMINGEQV